MIKGILKYAEITLYYKDFLVYSYENKNEVFDLRKNADKIYNKYIKMDILPKSLKFLLWGEIFNQLKNIEEQIIKNELKEGENKFSFICFEEELKSLKEQEIEKYKMEVIIKFGFEDVLNGFTFKEGKYYRDELYKKYTEYCSLNRKKPLNKYTFFKRIKAICGENVKYLRDSKGERRQYYLFFMKSMGGKNE